MVGEVPGHQHNKNLLGMDETRHICDEGNLHIIIFAEVESGGIKNERIRFTIDIHTSRSSVVRLNIIRRFIETFR